MTIRNFLLLSFDYLRPKDPNISLASSSIMAYLKSVFHTGSQPTLELHHRQYNVKNPVLQTLTSDALNDIRVLNPDVVATGVYVWNEPIVKSILEQLHETRSRPKYIILGGPQITYSFKGTLEPVYPFADFFIRGYAEESLGNLLKLLQSSPTNSGAESSDVEGVHIKNQSDKGLKSPYTLSNLPSSLLTPGLIQHDGYIRWETKRGCPFECAFCQHRDSYDKRLKCSADRIDKEQQWMVQNNIRDISVVDPIFNSAGGDYLEILRGFLKTGYKGRLNLQARFEMIKPEFLDLCSMLQASGVKVELEFGIQTMIKKESQVIKRLNNIRAVVKSANELLARQIPFEVSLIYGLPEQSLESFGDSVEWVRTFLKPNAIRAWPLMLLKGTALYDVKEKYNLREVVLDEDLEELDDTRQYKGIPHVVESSTFTYSDWEQMKKIALQLNNQ